jgi:hypothetical protein
MLVDAPPPSVPHIRWCHRTAPSIAIPLSVTAMPSASSLNAVNASAAIKSATAPNPHATAVQARDTTSALRRSSLTTVRPVRQVNSRSHTVAARDKNMHCASQASKLAISSASHSRDAMQCTHARAHDVRARHNRPQHEHMSRCRSNAEHTLAACAGPWCDMHALRAGPRKALTFCAFDFS